MTKNNPKISVIVPIYNAEKYLHRCIDSILNQTFTDFEVLLINDGSTDSSGSICDEYAKKDSRVRVFHKKNGGVASARNVGLENMRGEYSIHCDSDDWIEASMYEALYRVAHESNADIVWCDFYHQCKGGTFIINKQNSKEDKDDCVDKLILQKMHSATWNKLYRNRIIRENNLKFLDGVDLWEDLFFSISFFNLSAIVKYVPKPFYNYRFRQESLVNSLTRRKIQMQCIVVEKLLELFKQDLRRITLMNTMKLTVKNGVLFNLNYSHKEWMSLYPMKKLDIIYSRISVKQKIIHLMRHWNLTALLKPFESLIKYKLKKK